MSGIIYTIEKAKIPIIYLDTCIMIELSKFENHKCTNDYKAGVGDLYKLLKILIKNEKINCPLGNQMVEMGQTRCRQRARNFLYHFTNCEMKCPELIRIDQMKFGFEAFMSKLFGGEIGLHNYFKKEENDLIVHVTAVYSEEESKELVKEKAKRSSMLNEMKEKGLKEDNCEKQLKAELNAEAKLFDKYVLSEWAETEEFIKQNYIQFNLFTLTTGVTNPNLEILLKYYSFLKSDYYYSLPYVRIRAELWAFYMQRSNKIINSDELDVTWVSAYLPIADYVVTDKALKKTLEELELDKRYNAKIFSLDTLNELTIELKKLL